MLKQEFSYCRSLKCVGLIVLEKNNREIALLANKMTELFVTLVLTSFFFFSRSSYTWVCGWKEGLDVQYLTCTANEFYWFCQTTLFISCIIPAEREMWSCFRISPHHWPFLAEFYICGTSKKTDKWSIILSKYQTRVTVHQCLTCVPFQIRLRATSFL